MGVRIPMGRNRQWYHMDAVLPRLASLSCSHAWATTGLGLCRPHQQGAWGDTARPGRETALLPDRFCLGVGVLLCPHRSACVLTPQWPSIPAAGVGPGWVSLPPWLEGQSSHGPGSGGDPSWLRHSHRGRSEPLRCQRWKSLPQSQPLLRPQPWRGSLLCAISNPMISFSSLLFPCSRPCETAVWPDPEPPG